jgi:hypothetical protein
MTHSRLRLVAILAAIMASTACSRIDLANPDGKLRDWGTKSVDGGIRLNVRTKWREGKLLYLATLEPVDSVRALFAHRVTPEGMAKPDSAEIVPWALALELVDADGFKVDSIAIRVTDLSENWGSKTFDLRGASPVTLSAYKSISSWHPVIAMGCEDRDAEGKASTTSP